ncbi:MAG: HD-GYP domain-containing protein [Bacteriovoracia bacterium]
MQILLLHSDQQVREMVAFSLESKFTATTHSVGKLREAIDYLKSNSADLIIYEDQDETPAEFREFMAANIKVPRLVLTKLPRRRIDQKVVAEIDVNKDIVENLFVKINELIEKKLLNKPESDEEFVRIRTGLLIQASPLKGDVYIRLSKDHYVKLFHEGAEFSKEDLEKYAIKKKQEYLYLNKGEIQEFIQKYQVILTKFLALPVTKNTAGNMQISVHETIHELTSKIGFTSEVKELTKQNVQLALKTIGTSPRLSDVLNRMKVEKGQYISAHSMILAEMACAIAKNMSWTSEGTFYKLTMAAFLHDMTLKKNELAAVRTLAELYQKKDKFSEEDILNYKNHPLEAATIVKSFSEIPPDVDTVIFQHHEKPDGSGFPKKLTATYISQLAAVFIIAHEIVQATIEKNQPFEETIRQLREQYNSGSFKRILASIQT